jgi:hypothetical protein
LVSWGCTWQAVPACLRPALRYFLWACSAGAMPSCWLPRIVVQLVADTSFLVLTVLAGGVLALCVGGWSVIMTSSEIHDGPWLKRFSFIKPNVPYGYAFAIGAILAFPESWWMRAVG